MTTQVTTISSQEKQQLVARFVADVLAKRSIALVKAKHAILTKVAKKIFNKKTLDMVNKLYEMADDDDDVLNIMGIEVNTWLRSHGKKTKTLKYEPDMDLLHCLEASDIPGMPTELSIALTYEVIIDDDDWQWQLTPSCSDTPEGVEWEALQKSERKLREDARTLQKIAAKSVSRKRTWEAVEKNCPELAPYIDVPDENTPCPAELADLASCMRVKDDC